MVNNDFQARGELVALFTPLRENSQTDYNQCCAGVAFRFFLCCAFAFRDASDDLNRLAYEVYEWGIYYSMSNLLTKAHLQILP